jgi:hypothetical protein
VADWTIACGTPIAGAYVTDVAVGRRLVAPTRFRPPDADQTLAGVWVSDDGRTWTVAELPVAPSSEIPEFPVAAAVRGRDVVVGGMVGASEGALAWHSTDALAWDRVDVADTGGVNDVAVGPDGFVMVGVVDRYSSNYGRPAIWRSSDGRAWQRVGPAIDDELYGSLDQVEATTRGFVATGMVAPSSEIPDVWGEDYGPSELRYAGTPWVSTDGRTWSRVADGAPFGWAVIRGLVPVGPRIYAFGIAREPELVSAAWSSDDGSTWRRLVGGPPAASGEPAFTALPSGRIVEVGHVSQGPARVWVSDDEATWNATDPATIPGSDSIHGLAVSGDLLVAVGQSDEASLAPPAGCEAVPIWYRSVAALEGE